LEFNVPFQHKYGYIRDEHLAITDTGFAPVTRPTALRLKETESNVPNQGKTGADWPHPFFSLHWISEGMGVAPFMATHQRQYPAKQQKKKMHHTSYGTF